MINDREEKRREESCPVNLNVAEIPIISIQISFFISFEHLLSFLHDCTVPIIDGAESLTGTLQVLTGQFLLLGCLLPGWNVCAGSRTYYEHGSFWPDAGGET